MYENGSIITLLVDKAHGSGDTSLRLRSGICGMIAEGHNSGDGNHRYVVDFGPEGQWNCMHNEISGNNQPEEEESTISFTGDTDLTFASADIIPEPTTTFDEAEECKENVSFINVDSDIKRRIKELQERDVIR